MKPESKRSLPKKIFVVELIGFAIIILFLWIDEFFDIPHRLFGSQPTPINVPESVFETFIILCFGIVIGAITLRYSRELQRLHDEKDKLYSVISHDLRSPFGQLLLSTELMREKANTFSKEKLQRYVITIHNSAKKLFDMLENLLLWAQIQMETEKHEPEKIALDEMINSAIDLLSENASKKEISLSCKIEDSAFVFADRTMLNSVIQNLITNAIKFTRSGGKIEVSSNTRDKNVEVTVFDTGTGMNEETINKIFSMDSRHSRPGTSGERGTGLGLILSRELIEKMGGSIRVESEPGEGSTFRFTLPKAV